MRRSKLPLVGLAESRPDAFWLLALGLCGAAIYLPYLGSFPQWDPWEPHYTQVAWEMQERGTWLNPFYRGNDNWWSKPIWMLWMLRASLALFWDAATQWTEVELASRLPFALTAIAGGLLHYDWVRRLFGRTTGVIAALALITAPQYLLIGRQVMPDMPFLVAYSAAMGYLAVGLFTPRPEILPGLGGVALARAWLRREWPFVAFWGLQAVALLAKGFVPTTLAVLILLGYAAATFRWRDYAHLERPPLGRYLVVRGAIFLAVVGGAALLAFSLPRTMPLDQRKLLSALAVGVALVSALLGAFHALPPFRHGLHLLSRVRAAWGLPLFLAVAAPWFVYMTLEHGWPYWKEFIFYHHLGRAAGTIDKPSGTFDYYVRQLGFALFPWSGFLLGAAWQILGRASPLRSIAERKNLYVLLAALLPYLFFTLSGTKFAHYIFPVLPFAGVLVAATLAYLGAQPPRAVPLAEVGLPLGPPVPAHAEESPLWQRAGSKGDLVVFAAVSLVCFGILAHDLVLDFRYFLRLFIYDHNRGTPPDYQPFIFLQLLFFPAGLCIGLLLLSRAVTRRHLAGFAATAVVLACYLGWVTMPRMGDTFAYEPVWHAYQRVAKPDEALGQYNNWQQPERSVLFLFKNQTQHLKTDKLAKAFLEKPGRKFIIVDKDRLSDLRRAAKDVGKKLFVVFDEHPYARLISDVPSEDDQRRAKEHILSALPEGVTPSEGSFDDKLKLLGYRVEPDAVRPGELLKVSFYYQAAQVVDRDWEIFVHADGPRGASHRINGDHLPVEGLYPTNEWQEGEIVHDAFSLRVPRDYPYEQLTVWTGFYIGDNRMPVKGGASDGDNRVRGPTVRVLRE